MSMDSIWLSCLLYYYITTNDIRGDSCVVSTHIFGSLLRLLRPLRGLAMTKGGGGLAMTRGGGGLAMTRGGGGLVMT